MPGTEILLVNLLLVAGLLLWTMEVSARSRPGRLAAIMLLQGSSLAYAYWRYEYTLPGWDWTAFAIWPWVFFAAEMLVLTYDVWSLGVLTVVSNHTPAADTHERRLRRSESLPTVDVFVPSFSEGPEILRDTIRAALVLDYPPELVKIWILDDNRRPWLREMCSAEGVGYFARPTNEHGKAGNLNYAFPRTEGEFILIIDADFWLAPSFLYRTLGFMIEDEKIALVQTPQHFRNPDPIQHNLFGGRAWTEEQHFFMTMVESARDTHGNAFCVGSGWIVKRARLDELGGFPQASICEDLEISYVLKARGYRTLFLNEPLAVGLAPESVPEYIKQRARWCSGTIQHAYLKSGPFRAKGLSLVDRLFYIEPILYWMTFPFMILLIVAPIVFWHTGVSAIQGRNDGVWLLLIPRFLAGYILIYWLSERKVMPFVTAINKIVPAFHITAALGKAIVRPFGNPFKVTSKGLNRDGIVIQWPLLSIFLGLFVALFSGMALNLTGTVQILTFNEMTGLDMAWGGLTLLTLALCMLACVEQPKGVGYIDAAGEVRHSSAYGSIAALFKRLFA